MTRPILEKLVSWLEYLGITNIHYISESIFRFRLQTDSGSQYTIYVVNAEDSTILFESPVFPFGTSEDPNNTALFLELLLRYNGSVYPHQFGVIKNAMGRSITVLHSSQDGDIISFDYLDKVIRSFDFAYEHYVPEIYNLAEELNIEFHGLSTDRADQMMDDLFGSQ